MSDELKACPFCGGSASVAEVDCEDFDGKLVMACCDDCGVGTPASEDPQIVKELWNKRA